MSPIDRFATSEPGRRALSLYEEFRQFAFRGNVIDLAVGVIIGAAFGRIVDSLVKHVLMPFVAIVLPGEQSYQNWKWVVRGQEVPFGLFLAEVVNFLIVAFVLFLFVRKFLGWVGRLRREEVAAIPPMTKDQELLTEIRDLLRSRAEQPGGEG
jgi:large conductance mechanosensitive channel